MARYHHKKKGNRNRGKVIEQLAMATLFMLGYVFQV